MSENNVVKKIDEYWGEPDTIVKEGATRQQKARTREFKMICNEPKSGKKAKTPNGEKRDFFIFCYGFFWFFGPWQFHILNKKLVNQCKQL